MFWLVFIAAIAADQISKYLIAHSLALGESIPFLGDFLQFTYTVNKGASFSILQGQRWVFVVLTLAVLALVIWFYLKKVPKNMRVFSAALGLFCGGTVGNLIDRVLTGGVVDFLNLGWFPVFNVADWCICVGAVAICAMLLFTNAGKTLESNKGKGQKKK